MKRKIALALFVIVAALALSFTVSNFVPLAQADIVIYGTVTWAPWLHENPLNQFFHLYDDYYCLYEESTCSVVTVY